MLHTLTLKVVQLELALPQQVLAPHAGPREHEVVGRFSSVAVLFDWSWPEHERAQGHPSMLLD